MENTFNHWEEHGGRFIALVFNFPNPQGYSLLIADFNRKSENGDIVLRRIGESLEFRCDVCQEKIVVANSDDITTTAKDHA